MSSSLHIEDSQASSKCLSVRQQLGLIVSSIQDVNSHVNQENLVVPSSIASSGTFEVD